MNLIEFLPSRSRTRFLNLAICLGGLLAGSMAAQSPATPPSSETEISLSGSWRFALARTAPEADAVAGFYQAGFEGKEFKPIPVPSNWALLGYEEPVYRGFKDDKASEGFYLHDFTLPASWKGRRLLLHFGGVWSSAEVWLNGVLLGRHDSGYTSFAFDITNKVKSGESNRLAVRVRQVSREYKSDVYDDWTLGGIYRDVTLESMPAKRWLEPLATETKFDTLYQNADLKVRVMVNDRHKNTLPGNYPSPGEPYDLRVTLLTHDGVEVARRQLTVPAHTSTGRETRVVIPVERPHQWTAETPYLYTLRVELLENGQATQIRMERVGFREISTAGGVFRINGQAVKLRGVNRHDEHPDVGRATTRTQWQQDLALMKAGNINYLRLSHYAPAEGFVKLCDEMGMYVGEEVSLGGAGDLMNDPSFTSGVLLRAYETVIRDLNRPSIIYWSIGNEDPLTALHLAAVRTVKGIDPTRPVLLPWRAEEWLPPEIDILAPHYWQPGEYDRLASHSTRPVITTEYTHAYGLDAFGGLEARWKALTRHPAGAGGAIWMWADQGIKMPTPKPGTLSSDPYLRLSTDGWDGIVDSYRNPTRDYWEAKAVYAQVYPAVEKVNFVPGQASVRIPIQNDYDFTNLSALKVAWTINEDERELAKGSASLNGEPHAAVPFDLPLTALKTIRTEKTYYARFSFTDSTGNEVSRKAVELIPPVPAASVPGTSAAKIAVTRGDSITIQVGDTRYVFDPRTGQLASAAFQGNDLITGLRPTLWRKLDSSESSVIGKANARDAADLNKYTATVASWDIKEGADRVVIRAKVDYVINAENRFTASYDYSVGSDGRLNVHYEFRTKVAVPNVPVVGMTIDSIPDLNQVQWFGLGPYDAYPNKRSAPVLGVWSGTTGSANVAGTKAMRWVERAGAPGGFRVWNDGYLENDASALTSMRVLSGVLSRPEKGRKPDDTFPQLRTDTGEPFAGTLSIALRAAGSNTP